MRLTNCRVISAKWCPSVSEMCQRTQLDLLYMVGQSRPGTHSHTYYNLYIYIIWLINNDNSCVCCVCVSFYLSLSHYIFSFATHVEPAWLSAMRIKIKLWLKHRGGQRECKLPLFHLFISFHLVSHNCRANKLVFNCWLVLWHARWRRHIFLFWVALRVSHCHIMLIATPPRSAAISRSNCSGQTR